MFLQENKPVIDKKQIGCIEVKDLTEHRVSLLGVENIVDLGTNALRLQGKLGA